MAHRQVNNQRKSRLALLLTGLAVTVSLDLIAPAANARTHPVTINVKLHGPFRFVAYGDTRFTDPANTKAANAEARQELVRAIADVRPDFITFGGDIAYNGDDV